MSTPAGALGSLNAKLVVLEALCHAQGLVEPYDASPAREWGRVAPDAVAYYEGLEIPEAALLQVKELEFDGGLQIYHDVWPGWDGEDDYFDVPDHAPLAALPALELVSSTNPLGGEVRAVYEARGVEVDD